jgi:integrase
MKAWIFQDDKQLKKHGDKGASWYVGWIDPEGKRRCQSCGAGADGKKAAMRLQRKRQAELIEGTYEGKRRMSWDEFRAEYDSKILDGMGVLNRQETLRALERFERLVKPQRMQVITSSTILAFVAKRRTERGLKPGSLVTPATINKELRQLRAIFRKACKLGYLSKAPEFEFLKQPEKLPTYVGPEEFARIYAACNKARWPERQPFTAADWWRGLLIMAYMTGWRIGSLLALRWEDVDLEAGTAISRAKDNKGKRDQLVPLHPVVIEHLRKLVNLKQHPCVFPWSHGRRSIFEEFGRIQRAAGIRPMGPKSRYGFHDLRRAFATMNADRLTPDALQVLMQHKDYQTTQRYINMARQLNPAVQNLYVPPVKKHTA